MLNNNSDKNKIEEIYLAKQILNNNKKFRLGKLRKFVTPNHLKTKRNYIKRMNDDKILSRRYQKNILMIIGTATENLAWWL